MENRLEEYKDILILIFLLLSGRCISAMEFGLHSMWNGIFAQKSQKYSRDKDTLDCIPLDLQGKIVKNILTLLVFQGDSFENYIDRKELDKTILTQTPILLGHGYVNDFCSIMNKLVKSEFHKKCSLHNIYSLSLPQRKIVMNVGSSWFSFPGELFEDEYNAVKNMQLKEEFNVTIVPRSNFVHLLNGTTHVAGGCLFMSLPCIVLFKCIGIQPSSPLFILPLTLWIGGTVVCVSGLVLKERFLGDKKTEL